MTEQYDTGTLRRIGEGFGLELVRVGTEYNIYHGGIGVLSCTHAEERAWLAAFRHRWLTGKKLEAIARATGGRGITILDWGSEYSATAHTGTPPLDGGGCTETGHGAAIDEAVNALWEKVCLEGGVECQ